MILGRRDLGRYLAPLDHPLTQPPWSYGPDLEASVQSVTGVWSGPVFGCPKVVSEIGVRILPIVLVGVLRENLTLERKYF